MSPFLWQLNESHVAEAEIDQFLQKLFTNLVLDSLQKKKIKGKMTNFRAMDNKPGSVTVEKSTFSGTHNGNNTHMFGDEFAVLVLHRSILSKHIIKLVNNCKKKKK